MKQISALLAFVILFASCNPSKPVIPKFDKTHVYTVVYVANGVRNASQGMIDSIYAVPSFKDSNSLSTYWRLDTAWALSIPNQKDTARGPKNKPIYDSVAHSYKFNSMWYKLNPQERAAVKIQIITI